MQQFRTSTAYENENGDGIIIKTVQDVSAIVEKNKREFNSIDERARWGDIAKIASIPLTVIDDLNKSGIMRGFHVLDQKRLSSWLNHPDNRVFRTRPGTV